MSMSLRAVACSLCRALKLEVGEFFVKRNGSADTPQLKNDAQTLRDLGLVGAPFDALLLLCRHACGSCSSARSLDQLVILDDCVGLHFVLGVVKHHEFEECVLGAAVGTPKSARSVH
jgi:hypothetical protein